MYIIYYCIYTIQLTDYVNQEKITNSTFQFEYCKYIAARKTNVYIYIVWTYTCTYLLILYKMNKSWKKNVKIKYCHRYIWYSSPELQHSKVRSACEKLLTLSSPTINSGSAIRKTLTEDERDRERGLALRGTGIVNGR